MTRIFISHSHADEAISYELVDFLIEALGINSREILCTSNPDQGLSYSSSSITDQLKEQLKKSEALIVLITADSLHSAWIPFEAGSFWTTDKPIIPILGPGLTQNDLLGPLKSFLSIPIGAKDLEDRINSATNQIAEKLNLQQAFTKRRSFKLQRFLDALRAWKSQRPATPDLQQEIKKLEARIQELEQELQEKEQSAIAKLQEKKNLKRSLEVKIEQSKKDEEIIRLLEVKIEQWEKERSQKDDEIMRLRERLVERSQKNIEFVYAQYFNEKLGDDVELEMIAIPSGKFMMGSPELEGRSSEKPQHEVIVQAFHMSKYPITQAQYQQIMGKNPSHFQGDDQRPVESVSWEDAVEFCKKLSKETGKEYILPTEAEWEYACRSVISPKGYHSAYHQLSVISEGLTLEVWNKRYYQPYNFGETISSDLANYGSNVGKTTPVDKYLSNDFGLYGMHGNVWEWCQDDWYDSYKNAPTNCSVWLSEDSSKKVIRGGSWYSNPNYCRSAFRFSLNRADRTYGIGFRVVCIASRVT